MLTVHILQSFGDHRPGRPAQFEPETAGALARKGLVRIVGEPDGTALPAANATLNIDLPLPKFTTGQEAPSDGKSTNEGEFKPKRGAGRIKAADGAGAATVPAADGEPREGASTGR